MLSPVCGNPECNATGPHLSPMYRIITVTEKVTYTYYRYAGSGPNRKGCGYMAPTAEVDNLTLAVVC
jgi:hypothetical protein